MVGFSVVLVGGIECAWLSKEITVPGKLLKWSKVFCMRESKTLKMIT